MTGWRKLLFGMIIVVGTFGFLYWKTPVAEVGVPDIPPQASFVLMTVFAAYVTGNYGEWREKRKMQFDNLLPKDK